MSRHAENKAKLNTNAMVNQLTFEVKVAELRNKYFKLSIENYQLEKDFVIIQEKIEAERKEFMEKMKNAPIEETKSSEKIESEITN